MVGTTYVIGFIGGTLYTNNIGTKKFSHVQMKLQNRQVTPFRFL